jgi:hypothetical protein
MQLLIEPFELVLTIFILLTLLVELLPLLGNLILIPSMISGRCRRYQNPSSLHELLVGGGQRMRPLLGHDYGLIRDEHVCRLLIRVDVIGRETEVVLLLVCGHLPLDMIHVVAAPSLRVG